MTTQREMRTSAPKQTSTQAPYCRLSRIGFLLTINAMLFGFALFGFSTHCMAQEQTTYSEAAAHSGWVQIPGELIRPDCVHEIPKGARVEIAKDGSLSGDVTLNGEIIAHYDACPEQGIATRQGALAQGAAKVHEETTGNGWVEDDQWNAPLSSSDNIDYLAGNWTVPSYPSEAASQVIYLSNGIEPASHKWFLEAALQYGYNGVFGGNYYTIATWLSSSSAAYYSSPAYVNPGDSLSGGMQMTGESGSTTYWEAVILDNSSGYYSEGSYWVSGQHWTWAYAGVLEAYNLYACAEFPASGHEQFSDTVVAHGFPYLYELNPNWVGSIRGYGGPTCHFAALGPSGNLDF